MKLIVFVVVLALSTAFCFAAHDKGVGTNTDFAHMPPDQVVAALQNAGSIHVAGPTQDEFDLKICNGKTYSWFTAATSEATCLDVGDSDAPLYVSMEALFRGCGIFAVSQNQTWGDYRSGATCGVLGARFAAIGNFAAARAVWEQAPGCHSHDNAGNPVNGCIDFIVAPYPQAFIPNVQWTKDFYAKRENVYATEQQKVFAMAQDACHKEKDVASCTWVGRRGANVDLTAALDEESRRKNQNFDVFQAQEAAVREQGRESNERFNAVMSALQSMPAANDPNAIVNAGNQQAAAIRAAGNARANQQSVATTPATSAAAQSLQDTTAAHAAEGPSSPGEVTSEICPNTQQVYPDAGASCNPVRSESTCVKILSATWNPPTNSGDGMLRVTFQNICGYTVRITAWGPAGGSNPGETQNIGSGAQYVFNNDREQYQYLVDDGIDCSGNIMRPGCKSTGH